MDEQLHELLKAYLESGCIKDNRDIVIKGNLKAIVEAFNDAKNSSPATPPQIA